MPAKETTLPRFGQAELDYAADILKNGASREEVQAQLVERSLNQLRSAARAAVESLQMKQALSAQAAGSLSSGLTPEQTIQRLITEKGVDRATAVSILGELMAQEGFPWWVHRMEGIACRVIGYSLHFVAVAWLVVAQHVSRTTPGVLDFWAAGVLVSAGFWLNMRGKKLGAWLAEDYLQADKRRRSSCFDPFSTTNCSSPEAGPAFWVSPFSLAVPLASRKCWRRRSGNMDPYWRSAVRGSRCLHPGSGGCGLAMRRGRTRSMSFSEGARRW